MSVSEASVYRSAAPIGPLPCRTNGHANGPIGTCRTRVARCYTFQSDIAVHAPTWRQENTKPMTMSEQPRESISLNGALIPSETLVSVTDAAARKVIELRSREGKEEARLRLFVKSGGCSGFSYGLAFDDRVNEGDKVEDHDGVPIVIDQFSQQYVDGAEIDYVDSLMGSGFAINNPNAVSSCACGSSFNTDGSPGKAGGCAH